MITSAIKPIIKYCQSASDYNTNNLTLAIEKYAEEASEILASGYCGTNQLYHIQHIGG